MISLVLVAGGVSRRMGRDKLLIELAERTVTERSLSAFFAFAEIDELVVATNSEELKRIAKETAENAGRAVVFAAGGASRKETVQNGLEKVTNPLVLIHDAARPFVSRALIGRVVAGVTQNGSAVPALPMIDSVRIASDGRFAAVADRAEFYRVQTPQGFKTEELKRAYRNCDGETDECGAMIRAGCAPGIVEGEETNRKLTRAEDVFGVGTAVGIGYDVHRLSEGRRLMLGGIEVPAERGEVAHSDGDVLLHAVTDAVLSAAGERDIGKLFPDSDPQYKDISSLTLLEEVMRRVGKRGFIVQSVSAVVALEQPKLSVWIPKINKSIQEATGAKFVNVSATTTETLGIVGAGGVAAYAVACLLPE